nr:uncharacterized protein LOC108391123 isoform X5 [Manis javanica]
MRAWPQAPGRLLRDGMSLLLPLTEGPPRPLGCPFPLVPIPPAPAPLRYRRRTQLRSRGRPASSRLCGKPSLPGGSACAERLRRGRLSSEKSSLQPPAVGRRHAVVISSSVSLVRSCRATSVWGIQPTGPPTRRAQCLLTIFQTLRRESSQFEHGRQKGKISCFLHLRVWPKLKALYETGPPPEPHRYRPGDWVYVRRHQHQTLQPRWKGPYIVILTTPTALKVNGITPWVHCTHI